MNAAKARALRKRPRAALLKTPQILMSAARGGAQSPTAEGDAGAEGDGEDEPCEEDEADREENDEEDGGEEDEVDGGVEGWGFGPVCFKFNVMRH